MATSAVHQLLERAYEVLVECQDSGNEYDTLQAAYRVIRAWEAVSEEVTGMCQEAIAQKALTQEA